MRIDDGGNSPTLKPCAFSPNNDHRVEGATVPPWCPLGVWFPRGAPVVPLMPPWCPWCPRGARGAVMTPWCPRGVRGAPVVPPGAPVVPPWCREAPVVCPWCVVPLWCPPWWCPRGAVMPPLCARGASGPAVSPWCRGACPDAPGPSRLRCSPAPWRAPRCWGALLRCHFSPTSFFPDAADAGLVFRRRFLFTDAAWSAKRRKTNPASAASGKKDVGEK